MPFPRFPSFSRRRQHRREPSQTAICTPLPLSPLSRPIWAAPSQAFTGVHDTSLYDDVLDLVLSSHNAAQQPFRDAHEVPAQEDQAEVLFDADVWVELARAEERACGAEWDGEKEMEELKRLTEAFVNEYLDGECACLLGRVEGAVRLPGENFQYAGRAGDEGPEWVGVSVFEEMDEAVRDLWCEDNMCGTGEDSAIRCWSDCACGMSYNPLATHASGISDVSGYKRDVAVVDDETLRSEAPLGLYYFDADAQQYFGHTALNQLLACSGPKDAWLVMLEPSVCNGKAIKKPQCVLDTYDPHSTSAMYVNSPYFTLANSTVATVSTAPTHQVASLRLEQQHLAVV